MVLKSYEESIPLEELEKRLEEQKIIKMFVLRQLMSGLALRSIKPEVRDFLEQTLVPVEYNIECLIRDITIKKTTNLHIAVKDEVCQECLKKKDKAKG